MAPPVNRSFHPNELDRFISLVRERCRNRSPTFMEKYHRTLVRRLAGPNGSLSAKVRAKLFQFMKTVSPKRTTLAGEKTSDKTDMRLGSIKIRDWEDLCKMDPSKFGNNNNLYDFIKSLHTTKPSTVSRPLSHSAVREHMDQIGAVNLHEPKPRVDGPREPNPLFPKSDYDAYNVTPLRYIVHLPPNHPLVLKNMDKIRSTNRYILNSPHPSNKLTHFIPVGSIGDGKLFEPETNAKNSKDYGKISHKPTPVRCVTTLSENDPVVLDYFKKNPFVRRVDPSIKWLTNTPEMILTNTPEMILTNTPEIRVDQIPSGNQVKRKSKKLPSRIPSPPPIDTSVRVRSLIEFIKNLKRQNVTQENHDSFLK